ncbi:TIGR02206 family membrane protein [Metabacillus sp. RGM 3146]|uniref:YwaF family protein n=1 Tax=Metabacillus sp. RGM 3146 TaxID=3401092 RepID=UPI003B9C70F4
MFWDAGDHVFEVFSFGHLMAIGFLAINVLLLYSLKNKKKDGLSRSIEIGVAVLLLLLECLYHIWQLQYGKWKVSHSLPLEQCSISLLLTIILLFTGSRRLYDIVFFTGIAGALQAISTPVLFVNFPHFRYFHFFLTHIGIIWTSLYFTWMKGYKPTFFSLLKAMLFLNILLPFILLVNKMVNGNYMFLSRKPATGSILDFLGPYPWYIVSLEAVAFIMFFVLWLLFRERKHNQGKSKNYPGQTPV